MSNVRRIGKVKMNKEKRVTMEYEEKNMRGQWDQYSFSCSDAPRPEFEQALASLAEHVVTLCELPEDYTHRITVKSVSFSYGGEAEVMGAVISAGMKLENSNQPLNLNTPHKASESYSAGPADENQLLPGKCVKALDRLQDECMRYIMGDRAQMQLFGPDDADQGITSITFSAAGHDPVTVTPGELKTALHLVSGGQDGPNH